MSTKIYCERFVPKHPRADKGGCVPAHVLVMERNIGRYLVWHGKNNSGSEIVHHINGDGKDNRIENLRLMRLGKHIALHRKLEALRRRASGSIMTKKPSKRRVIRDEFNGVYSSVAEEFAALLSVG